MTVTRWTPGPGERVEVERLGRDERLALAGLHLGDVALVEDDAAHHLHLEQLDLTVAAEGLAHRGERLEEQLLERLAVLEPLLELRPLPPSSASESFSNSGWSERTYSAWSAIRLRRRPSPARRTFSKVPSAEDIGLLE